MVNVELTRNERRLYEIMAEREGRDVSVEEIADEFYSDRRNRPKNWRGSMTAQMRGLGVKVYALGLGNLERTSRLGTGSPAVYCFISAQTLESEASHA